MTTNNRCRRIERKSAVEVAEGLIYPEFKAAKDGSIEGYGAIFGNVDQGYDIVEAGAFSESLKSGVNIKMLWQHDPYNPIGVWDEVREDDKGLFVKGRILSEVEKGREATALVKAGAIDGLSIGYQALKARQIQVKDNWVRVIEKAKLWEVSLVTFPMNAEATIDAVKAAAMTEREFEKALRDAGMSRTVRHALMRDGHKGVQALRDAGDEDYSELLEVIQASSLSEHL